MKTLTWLLIPLMTSMAADDAYANNNKKVSPPNGPYQSQQSAVQNLPSANNSQATDKHSASAEAGQAEIAKPTPWLNNDVPDWVKQRQAEMEKWQQQATQQSAPEWTHNYPAEAPEWVKQRQLEMQQQYQQQIPDWVKKRQAEMERWRSQQANMQPQTNWGYQQQPQWPGGQNPVNQGMNRIPQYLPNASGPAYAPPPPDPQAYWRPPYWQQAPGGWR